ncbi:hypothetical protein [Tengunoibacter tsumagoiensis]|uniref:hypothetical protein n=1 Tax=Tengunoibacter tsumagoiensis TaxID=2014871 RepID=UPI001386F9B4|nr:hypothetical protein [Tengunoibacter tsumagoiensis]
MSLDEEEWEAQDIVQNAQALLGASIRSSFSLLKSKSSGDIGNQLIYDFAYLCLQHYRGVLSDINGYMSEREWITQIYKERYMSKDVPPLVEKPEEEAN